MAAALGRRPLVMTVQGAPFLARVCGLVMQADIPIPGLRPLDAGGVPDIRVRMQRPRTAASPSGNDVWFVSPYHDDRGVPLLTIHALGASYLLSYAEGARFLVSASGSEVDAWWDPPLTAADAADYLLGSVLAFIVRRRGMVPLHASAVVIEDHAVLFAGPAGAGKSSLAAAFAVLGHPVISDDIVVIDDSRGLAYPSHPRLSVWPDSADSLFPEQSLPEHSPVYVKRRLDLLERGYRFHDSALPVGIICVLGERVPPGGLPAIRALPPQAALMRLVSHSYGNYLLDAAMRAREFDVLGRLAASVRVSELSLGTGLDALVADCRGLAVHLALQSAHAT